MRTTNCRRHVLLGCVMTTIVTIAMARCVVGFSPTPSTTSTIASWDSKFVWELNNVIEAQTEDFVENEEGLGGVKLAKESAVKVVGDIQHKPGKAESSPNDLLRYKNLKSVDESTVQNVLKNVGSTIICSGQGVEEYKDPGQTTNKVVLYAPLEAVKNAITNAASAMESEKLVLNFLGGDDLMVGEVMEAGSELVLALDIPTKTKISFNSISHKTIPSGTCSITVVSVGGQASDSLSGVEKAVAQGEVYSRDGNWYTVEESDINTDTDIA